MGKKINTERAIRTLQSKGVAFLTDMNIDLSKAKGLGNKSFGALDYFKNVGFRIVGLSKLRAVDGRYYPNSDDNEGGKKPKPVIGAQGERKWHSNADLVREKCSETIHLIELNRLQTKINNKHLYHKTKAEKRMLKDIKMNLNMPFRDTTLWHSEFEPKDIPLNKSKQ